MTDKWHVGTSDGWYVHTHDRATGTAGYKVFAQPHPGEPMSRKKAEALADRWRLCGYLPYLIHEDDAAIRWIMER